MLAPDHPHANSLLDGTAAGDGLEVVMPDVLLNVPFGAGGDQGDETVHEAGGCAS